MEPTTVTFNQLGLAEKEIWLNERCDYKPWLQPGATEYFIVFIYHADWVIECKFDKRVRLLRAEAMTLAEARQSIDENRSKHVTYESVCGGKFLVFVK